METSEVVYRLEQCNSNVMVVVNALMEEMYPSRWRTLSVSM